MHRNVSNWCVSFNFAQLTRKFSHATVDSVRILPPWNKFVASCGQQMCLIKAYYAICSGPIQIKIQWDGVKTIEVLVLHLVRRSVKNQIEFRCNLCHLPRLSDLINLFCLSSPGCQQISSEKWFWSDMSGPPGCRRWIRILCETTIGNAIFSSKLLRRIRQRR